MAGRLRTAPEASQLLIVDVRPRELTLASAQHKSLEPRIAAVTDPAKTHDKKAIESYFSSLH
jgi:hypothetical protein